MPNICLRNCVLFITLLGTTAAMADENIYLGLRVGSEMNERFDYALDEINADTPYGAYGGWNFSDHWGVELGYTDVGETFDSLGISDAGFGVEGSLLTAGLSYRHLLGERFDVFGAAGFFDLSEDGSELTIAGPRPVNRDDSGAYIEVGGRYHFSDAFALRASYQWFDFKHGDDATPWIGVELSF